uniref:Cytochrome b6/f complex subunit VIII n=1 Tax=Guibourtia ehie TaxID=162788 RepID=A0A8F3JBT9_9FABA|nr:cytochrome b6/f complex subunit VIII [Guibourtia ehie]
MDIVSLAWAALMESLHFPFPCSMGKKWTLKILLIC